MRGEGFSAEALEVLRGHGWPGNLRELRAVVGQAALAAGDRQIEATDLPVRFAEAAEATTKASLRDVEMRHILRVLDGVRGNQPNAWVQPRDEIGADFLSLTAGHLRELVDDAIQRVVALPEDGAPGL